jgi:catechol 2,3-dioxygenase-like lactoylglutathione lyase family enzyme
MLWIGFCGFYRKVHSMRQSHPPRQRLLLAPMLLLLLALPAGAQENGVAPSWASVTVGVANLDRALEFWMGTLGFDTLASADGEDAELATLWRILPEDIKRQALLGQPGSAQGRLHLVEFSAPGPAVREGTRVNDPGPQSLVVYARDLKTRVKEMQQAGLVFHSAEPVEASQADGIQQTGIRLGIHDEVSVILRELHGAELAFNPRGFSGIAALVNVVEFAGPEKQFLAQELGLASLGERTIEGTGLEQLMGLATGAILESSSWGATADSPGQIQLDDYSQVSRGNDLYPVAVPTQLGILHVTYAATGLDTFKQQLLASGYRFSDREYREVMYGTGQFIRLRTPAGMNIEVFE